MDFVKLIDSCSKPNIRLANYFLDYLLNYNVALQYYIVYNYYILTIYPYTYVHYTAISLQHVLQLEM